MLISEAARRAGVSRDTVRLYTRLGLVTCVPRKAASRSYADYDEAAVELIRNIKIAQSIGFSLAELVPIAAAYVAGRLEDAEQRELLAAKLSEIEERQRRLAQMAEYLRSKLSDLPATD
jgi:MerR family transcriptional regulator, copper efflux regulator